VNSEGYGKLECFLCLKMYDTGSPGPIFQARQDENICGKILTHFRVQIGLYMVQKCPFGTYLPPDVENLWKE
jgi:hypothetical protein